VFRPPLLLEAVAKIFIDQVPIDGDVLIHADVIEGSYQGSAGADDEEEEEVGEGEEEEEEGGLDDDYGVSGVDGVDDDEIWEGEDDIPVARGGKSVTGAGKAKTKDSSKNGTIEKSQKEMEQQTHILLPIEEDAVAHSLLKRLIEFELAPGASKPTGTVGQGPSGGSGPEPEQAGDADIFLDNDGEDGIESKAFSSALVELLVANQDRLKAWLSKNRPCFSLLELCKVGKNLDKIKVTVKNAKVLKAALDEASGSHAGGKQLKAVLKIK